MTRVVHLRSGHGLYGAERALLALAAATEPPLAPVVVSLVRPGREDALGDGASQLGLEAVRVEAPGRLSLPALGSLVRLARGGLLHAHDYKSLLLALTAAAVARVWRNFSNAEGSDLKTRSAQSASRLFGAMLRGERAFIRRFPLPFGLSVFAVGRKVR